MGLTLRMMLYFVFASLANEGIVLFDAGTGTVSFKVDDLALLASGVVGYLGTFVAGRWFKARGGST